jgi:hypothetical protein
MPHITLQPMLDAPDLPGGVAVGIIDGQPLVYVGRQPHRGTVPLDPAEVNPAMVGAAEIAARSVFGPEWIQDLARVTGLNPRTVGRDRIGRWGLPLPAMLLLSRAAGYKFPRAIGYAMLAVVEVRFKLALPEGKPGTAKAEIQTAEMVFAHAAHLVREMSEMRMKHRAPALQGDASD